MAPARPAHDGDPDSPHALADRLRRPRHDLAARAAGGPAAGRDQAGRGGRADAAYELHPRPAARGPPGLCRLPAGRRVGEARRGKAAEDEAERLAAGRAARLPRRRPPRPDAGRAQGRGDGGVRRRRHRRARRDHGGGGRDRRAERDRDGRSRGPSATASPSCTSCGEGSGGASTGRTACSSPRRRASWPGGASSAVEGERDGFRLAELDLALRGEGEVLGTRQHGLPRFSVAELPEDVGAPGRRSRGGDGPDAQRTAPLPTPRSAPCSTPPTAGSAPEPIRP